MTHCYTFSSEKLGGRFVYITQKLSEQILRKMQSQSFYSKQRQAKSSEFQSRMKIELHLLQIEN